MEIFFISLIVLVFGAFVSLFINENRKMKFCAVISGLSTAILMPLVFQAFSGKVIFKTVYLSGVFDEADFSIDALSAFFILLISVMSFIGALYAQGYIKHYLHKGLNISAHAFFLMILTASMLGLCAAQNALVFLFMWEIMSLSSFFLVVFERNDKTVLNAGIKYMVYMHICVIFLIAAFVLMYNASGSLNFSDFTSLFVRNKHFANIIFALTFIGFGAKAGFMPFHSWLPDAHPAAPAHVSGLMSGIMIKTGIYGILRMLLIIGMPSKFIAYTILSVSVISALWGVLYAVTQHDIKKLLAYHSIENIGIIGIGIGTGLLGIIYNNPAAVCLGFAGGILHILNHSIFKMLLFFGAGSIYIKTHLRDIELMGGLIKKMPYTGALFIIGALAICALPPFNGFISEILIYAGLITGLKTGSAASFTAFAATAASLAVIGAMAVLCFTKASGIMLLGQPRSAQVQNAESDNEKTMLIPMSVLAALTLLIGIFPQSIISLITKAVKLFAYIDLTEGSAAVNSLAQAVSIVCISFTVITVLILFLRFSAGRKQRSYSLWGCGYDRITPRMQYTASSYADLFVSALKPMFKRVPHIKKPKGLFPKEAYYELKIKDIEEAYIIEPLIKLDEKLLSRFERLQDGSLQHYIMYCLIFLIAAIAGLYFIG